MGGSRQWVQVMEEEGTLIDICCAPLPLTALNSLHPRCISTLYKDPAWSQGSLQGPTEQARTCVCSSKKGAVSPERLQYYAEELKNLESSSHSISLIDLWGLLVEYFLYQEVREGQATSKHSFFPPLLLQHFHLSC